MILEVAILNVVPSMQEGFEEAFRLARPLIAASAGYISHELRRCMETPNRYLLLVQWQTLEDHTIGFRGSQRYLEWKALLHKFYDPFPTVEHYAEMNE
ncbi:antibiotic biosynthesis monooxygenase [Acidobacterium sp. S8]|uniref:antibiotic biosynthesis monooxygenase family protein n=1 Tax=Acidobacterium sp. S8 TaxID=1641854 RepID=UPI00131AD69E|nr:antibiotic biosynthesis monooxygenase [Acidobacterium sp. S8]